MRISVITVCLNSEKTIEDTIKSVLGQTYKEIEYIIIDGASTDNTMRIVDKYKNRIAKIVSEKDKGIYEAMNKGLSLATGDVIAMLNSDDFYYDNTVVQRVVDLFEEEGSDAVYGDLQYLDKDDKTKKVRFWKSGKYSPKLLQYGWVPPHPTFFAKQELYQQYGYFDTDFKISADYELMLRFLKRGDIKLSYIAQPLVYMRSGGIAERSLKNKIIGWAELYRAWFKNGFGFPLFLPLRVLFKFKQFGKRFG